MAVTFLLKATPLVSSEMRSDAHHHKDDAPDAPPRSTDGKVTMEVRVANVTLLNDVDERLDELQMTNVTIIISGSVSAERRNIKMPKTDMLRLMRGERVIY